MVIGYYVHHHGAGHLTRAHVIASALRARGADVVLLGSDLRGAAGVTLPRDNDGPELFIDPHAAGALHWAPLGHAGFSARMQTIAAWVKDHTPSVVVVDVSVEVVTLLRLLGVPTVVVAQPGDRCDEAHTLAYRCATAIMAPWPAEADPCPALRAFADKVTHTGGISGQQVQQRTPQVGVVLTGRGGELYGRRDDSNGGLGRERPGIVESLRADLPGMTWVEAGGQQWIADVGPLLARAAVVISHCGQNAVADCAALNVPAVLCPQPRPHAEQEHLSAEISRLGLAQTSTLDGDAPTDWSPLVERATHSPTQWERWLTLSAPARAADLIADVSGA